MILEEYLKVNGTSIKKIKDKINIPESTLRALNNRELEEWAIKYIIALASGLKKSKLQVITELFEVNESLKVTQQNFGEFNIENRRYIGNKAKIMPWISQLILDNTEGKVFFDVFAGTGIVSKYMMEHYEKIILNDFLYSNEIIYKGFFTADDFDKEKLYKLQDEFNSIDISSIDHNYFSINFGDKFFSKNDAMIIGEIRERIEKCDSLTTKEYAILMSSLLYSIDKIANTVGHYDAYRKIKEVPDKFYFHFIKPINSNSKEIEIYREDSNTLVRDVSCDIAFIDPPYNSRQYSRFYHLLENVTTWRKPELNGVARKPEPENMSDYCRVSATKVFEDLIKNIKAKYIVVTYNNTYNSKSNSSRNKIEHDEILETLNSVGTTKVFEMPYRYFNAGKTNLEDHKEFLFITKVGK